MKVNLNDAVFKAARRRGYLALADTDPEAFEMSFVGQWVIKYKNDLKSISILSQITGKDIPEWSDLTERTLKNFYDEVTERMCASSAKTTFAKMKSVINSMREEVEIPVKQKRLEEIFAIRAQRSEHVYLTEEELIAFSQVETKFDDEKYVKCVCMLEACTGARHIDCVNFKKSNINKENDTLTYTSQKTHITATVPVIFDLEHWMKKCDHELELQDFHFNDILRQLLCRAKVGQKVVSVFSKGERVEKPKYQFCSSHTFRRSFATNLFLGGVDIADICQMMGHTSTEMTMRYICATRFVSKRPKKHYIAKNIYRYE